MSGKFGLDDHEETPPVAENLSAALSTFGAVRPRAPIDLPAVDAAAERHGFVSREAPAPGSISVSSLFSADVSIQFSPGPYLDVSPPNAWIEATINPNCHPELVEGQPLNYNDCGGPSTGSG